MKTKIISVEEAIEMKKEYQNTIAPLIESRIDSDYQATNFAWIDLDSLKEYMALLEEVMTINDKEISGVRIYFSAYPDAATFRSSGNKINYPARETIFFAPTIKTPTTTLSSQHENLENLPFCIEPADKTNSLKGNFVVINELLCASDNKGTTTATTTATATENTSLILNNMGVTPPPN